MSSKVIVSVIPACDVCRQGGEPPLAAYADAKLNTGPWANVCKPHFDDHGCRLGTGRGQEFVLREGPEPSQDDRIKDNLRGADFSAMSYEDFEDMFEDRDPFEFL